MAHTKKGRARAALCISALILAAAMAGGADAPAVYTVDSLVGIALQRSELIKSQEEFVVAAAAMKKQYIAWQNPSLYAGGGMKFAEGKKGYLYAIEVSQPFYFPGKTPRRGAIADADEAIAKLSLEETRLIIRCEVVRLAYSCALADEMERHLDERMRRFRTMEGFLKSRPVVSPRKRMERNIVQARMLLLAKNMREVRTAREAAWARLNLYLGFPGKIRIDAGWLASGPVLDYEALRASAISGNVEIRKMTALCEKTRKEASLSEREAYPDVELKAFFNHEHAGGDEKSAGAGVSLKLPVLDRNAGALRASRARAKAQWALLRHQKRVLEQELSSAFSAYNAARASIERLPMGLIEKIHRDLAEADAEFERGTIDLLTYLEVENQAYDMHLAVFNAQKDLVESYVTIMALAGLDIPTGGGRHAEKNR